MAGGVRPFLAAALSWGAVSIYGGGGGGLRLRPGTRSPRVGARGGAWGVGGPCWIVHSPVACGAGFIGLSLAGDLGVGGCLRVAALCGWIGALLGAWAAVSGARLCLDSPGGRGLAAISPLRSRCPPHLALLRVLPVPSSWGDPALGCWLPGGWGPLACCGVGGVGGWGFGVAGGLGAGWTGGGWGCVLSAGGRCPGCPGAFLGALDGSGWCPFGSWGCIWILWLWGPCGGSRVPLWLWGGPWPRSPWVWAATWVFGDHLTRMFVSLELLLRLTAKKRLVPSEHAELGTPTHPVTSYVSPISHP